MSGDNKLDENSKQNLNLRLSQIFVIQIKS